MSVANVLKNDTARDTKEKHPKTVEVGLHQVQQ